MTLSSASHSGRTEHLIAILIVFNFCFLKKKKKVYFNAELTAIDIWLQCWRNEQSDFFSQQNMVYKMYLKLKHLLSWIVPVPVDEEETEYAYFLVFTESPW